MTVSSIVDETATNSKVIVSWTDTQGPNWIAYRIYVQSEQDSVDWTLVYETSVSAGSYDVDVWQYTNAPTQRITVVEVELVSGEVVEGTYNHYNQWSPAAVDRDYWLIHETNPNLSLQFEQVISDSFTDQWERQDMVLLGRGRKVNLGSRLGRTGTLSIHLRDSTASTAREKRKTLTDLYALGNPMWLRDPFGDLIKISLGEPSVTRLEGYGSHEAVDVSLPYLEVI